MQKRGFSMAQNTLYIEDMKKKSQQMRRIQGVSWRRFTPFFSILSLLILWQLLAAAEVYPAFLLPPPLAVLETFREVLADGSLWHHTQVTLYEMLVGLAFGVSSGVLLGYLIARHPLLEQILAPVIVAFQSTPIVAYAPLLIIWFGSGPASKIVTSAVIVFFPTLMNTIVGIRSVPVDLRDLMKSLRASWWQAFIKLEIPAAMPVLLTGLKTSVTLAVIGAVVGEFVSAGEGLGFLVTLARNQYNTPLVFVAVLTMTALSLSLYGLVSLIEWRVLRWQRSQ